MIQVIRAIVYKTNELMYIVYKSLREVGIAMWETIKIILVVTGALTWLSAIFVFGVIATLAFKDYKKQKKIMKIYPNYDSWKDGLTKQKDSNGKDTDTK